MSKIDTFLSNLTNIRNLLGLTQDELAEYSKISKPVLIRLEAYRLESNREDECKIGALEKRNMITVMTFIIYAIFNINKIAKKNKVYIKNTVIEPTIKRINKSIKFHIKTDDIDNDIPFSLEEIIIHLNSKKETILTNYILVGLFNNIAPLINKPTISDELIFGEKIDTSKYLNPMDLIEFLYEGGE